MKPMTQLAAVSMAALIPLLAMQPANAQSIGQLQQENAQLRAQLQTLQQRCGTPLPDNPSAVSQTGQIQSRIASLRVGADRHNDALVTVAITLTNTGNAPLALNYEGYSFNLTDDHGYQYNVHGYGGSVTGIPTATRTSASANQLLGPGQSQTVTFSAFRSMNRGQTPGTVFDVNATFGEYQDEGQGRIRKLRTYPVAFTNVQRSAAAYTSDQPGQSQPAGAGSKVIDQLVDGLFKGRK